MVQAIDKKEWRDAWDCMNSLGEFEHAGALDNAWDELGEFFVSSPHIYLQTKGGKQTVFFLSIFFQRFALRRLKTCLFLKMNGTPPMLGIHLKSSCVCWTGYRVNPT
jgi:hypothetical protein